MGEGEEERWGRGEEERWGRGEEERWRRGEEERWGRGEEERWGRGVYHEPKGWVTPRCPSLSSRATGHGSRTWVRMNIFVMPELMQLDMGMSMRR